MTNPDGSSAYTPNTAIDGLYPPAGIDGNYAMGFSAPTWDGNPDALTPIMESSELLFLTQVADAAWEITQTIETPQILTDESEWVDLDEEGDPIPVYFSSAWLTAHLRGTVCGAIAQYISGWPTSTKRQAYLYVYERSSESWDLTFAHKIASGRSPTDIKVRGNTIALRFIPPG